LGIKTAFSHLPIPAFRNAKLAEHWPPDKKIQGRRFPDEELRGVTSTKGTREVLFSIINIQSWSWGYDNDVQRCLWRVRKLRICGGRYRTQRRERTEDFINLPKEGQNQATGEVDIRDEDRRKGFSRMDHLFPKGNARDRMPDNKQGVHTELCSAQIQLRLAKIEEAYHLMILIHDGQGEDVARASLREKNRGRVGGGSRRLKGIDWESWKNRFHLQQVTILGHSFGAATTDEAHRHKDFFNFTGQDIIYDVWGAAMQPPEDD
jgi:platelet-activating factor acetylhydrolase